MEDEIREHFRDLIDDETLNMLIRYAKGENHEVVRGVFLGGRKDRFAVAVESSVWICRGKFDFERGDLVELKGFSRGEFLVVDAKVLGKSSVPNVWECVSKVVPLKTFNLRGRVSGFSGEFRRSAVIHISDGSGRIRVVLVGDNAEIYRDLDVGDWVELYNCTARFGYDGEMEVVCDRGLAIKVF